VGAAVVEEDAAEETVAEKVSAVVEAVAGKSAMADQTAKLTQLAELK